VVATLKGNAHPILTGERTALNFIQRLSGIATATHSFVKAVKGTKVAITDTRKTTPGWRQLEKWAVRKGGGVNHRIGLYDAVLIKENHATASNGLSSAINRIRKIQFESQKDIPIFVEVERLEQLDSVIKSQPDRIMLDNMGSDVMRTAVKSIRKSDPTINIEATGGFSLSTVRDAAETGVDLISVGSLTHSAPAFDLTLLFKTAKD
jgi:nicotinate-nucleotide pyrophosphorylase (carboxylating)